MPREAMCQNDGCKARPGSLVLQADGREFCRTCTNRRRLEEIAAALEGAGLVRDGETRSESVRVATRRSPVYGRGGGELRTFGGRERWRKPGTDVRVTVGSRTVNVYTASPGGPRFLVQYETNVLGPDELRALLELVNAKG